MILHSVKDHVLSFVRFLEEVSTGGQNGWETGSHRLDYFTGGFKPGQFVVIGARPSVGKTAFALWLARGLSKTKKVPVAFISLEMLDNEVMARLASMESGIDSRKISAGIWSAKEKTLIAQGVSSIGQLPFFLSDDPKITVVKIREGIKLTGAKVVFLDYIQLMRLAGSHSRQEEVEKLSRELKLLAQEQGICLIGLSQLTREAEGQKPSLSSLRQSGALEQDADMVILLHGERTSNRREIIVSKNRSGPVGTIHMEFLAETCRFLETPKPGE